MLAALAQGVKGGKWHSLIDKLYPIATLMAAFESCEGQSRRGRGGSREH